jgi:cation diffusion facilitator family transporter
MSKPAQQRRGSASGSALRLTRTKAGAAWVSVLSNSALIVLKLFAAIVTGSIALLTEAFQSIIDLLASSIALISIRRAEQPPDADHPYGHEKAENLAAAFEGVLILGGAALIIYEAAGRIADPPELDSLGVGIAVIAVTIVINLVVSAFLSRKGREFGSPALEGDAAHLFTDALSSIGVLAGLLAVALTDEVVLDAIAAILVALVIVYTGVRIVSRSGRVLVDEAPPAEELDRIEATIASAAIPDMVGYHKLRARRAGRRRWIDLHVQFRKGTSLEQAHAAAHRLRDAIRAEVPGADVLIHVEPESSKREMRDSPLRWGEPGAE